MKGIVLSLAMALCSVAQVEAAEAGCTFYNPYECTYLWGDQVWSIDDDCQATDTHYEVVVLVKRVGQTWAPEQYGEVFVSDVSGGQAFVFETYELDLQDGDQVIFYGRVDRSVTSSWWINELEDYHGVWSDWSISHVITIENQSDGYTDCYLDGFKVQ